VVPVANGQPLTHHQPQPEEGRQLRALEKGFQSGVVVEKRVLKHVGSIEAALKSRVHAQFDQTAQTLTVVLKQVRKGLAVTALESLNQMQGIACIIRHDAHHTLLPAQCRHSGTKKGLLGSVCESIRDCPGSPPNSRPSLCEGIFLRKVRTDCC
jgi:hypothetical protein